MKDQSRDHVRRHADFDCGGAGRVGVQHRADIVLGKVEPILEEERAYERKLLELGQCDWSRFDELPLGRKWVELVDELVGICEKVMIVVLVAQAIV